MFEEWPKNVEIDGIKLVCTCGACPEQYTAYDSTGKEVGYLRLRHGNFRVDYLHCGGETIYQTKTIGDGIFDDNERDLELKAAVAAIKKRISECLDKNNDALRCLINEK